MVEVAPFGPLGHAFSNVVDWWHFQVASQNNPSRHAYGQRSDMLSFPPDGSLFASTLQTRADNVVVWDVERIMPVAKFNINATVRGLVFTIEAAGCEGLFEASNWNGFLISPSYDRRDLYRVLG